MKKGLICMSGKLIRLFLVDGNPNGLRTVEISNMTIYATIFPRTKLKDFLNRSESKKPGSYILLGNSIIENRIETIAYVGEGDPVENRLKIHATGKKQKDYWNEAIVFTSKDDYITKTQIQFLESEIIRLAKEADKVTLKNEQIPSKPNLSEVDNAEMSQFLDGVKLILSSLGIDILESQEIKMNEHEEREERIFRYSIKNANAKMKIEEEKYIVLKGSTAVINNRPSAGEPIIRMRDNLKKKGIIELDSDNKCYVFTKDYMFDSPSYAAAAIAGGEENGRVQWKYKDRNLNEIEESEIEGIND